MDAASNPTSLTVPTAQPSPSAMADQPDWVKRGAIVTLIVGGLIGGLAYLCFRGTYPPELLGGRLGVYGGFALGFCILVTGGLIFYYRKKQKDAEASAASS